MSIKSALKAKIGDSVIWEVLAGKRALQSLCVMGAFVLGWCSWDKLKAFLRENGRRRRIVKKKMPVPATYNGKKIFERDDANKIIGDAIEKGEPFMAGRYGSGELHATWIVRDDGRGFMFPKGRAYRGLCNNAGFFPKDKDMFVKFGMLMREATYQVDLMGIWWNPMEEWMLRTYGNNPEYCRLGALGPESASDPWSAHLEGKKVVVIHPFEKSIRSQYAKRELLFPGKNVLPEFELRVVKAVQTIAGNRDERFATWFDALEYMFNEAMSQDFDVAIIGCGAYGFPLAAKIKQAGKVAIHLGGATQLLFGIKGLRWFREYNMPMLNNPAWVFPLEEERPKGYKTIEGGCYW